jgi:hypothetical protein
MGAIGFPGRDRRVLLGFKGRLRIGEMTAWGR